MRAEKAEVRSQKERPHPTLSQWARGSKPAPGFKLPASVPSNCQANAKTDTQEMYSYRRPTPILLASYLAPT